MSWEQNRVLGPKGHLGPGRCTGSTPNTSLWGTVSTSKEVVLTCRAQLLRIITQCKLVDTSSFTLQGQRPASNLDVTILCHLDKPSPVHAISLRKRVGKNWSSWLGLMLSRRAMFLLPREFISCRCWHFCGRLGLSHLRDNIKASVKQSFPALKGRRDLRGTMPWKIQHEALWHPRGGSPSGREPRVPVLQMDLPPRWGRSYWQTTIFTLRIGPLSSQRKLLLLKWQSRK